MEDGVIRLRGSEENGASWLFPGLDEVSGSPGSPRHQTPRTAMEHYAGLDVSAETTSLCVVDEEGAVVCERKVLSDPAAIGEALERPGTCSNESAWKPAHCRNGLTEVFGLRTGRRFVLIRGR